MTRSKDLLEDIEYQPSRDTLVQLCDAETSKVLGHSKVIIYLDTIIGNVLLAETCAFNLLFVHQLSKMVLCTFYDVDMVTVMWSNNLKVAFVGHVEEGMYPVDFPRVPTK